MNFDAGELDLPDDRLIAVGALLARHLEEGHTPSVGDLEKVGQDLNVPARPLLHLLGYLPLAKFGPRTGYRPNLMGADERVWHHGWDKSSASVPVVLDHSDPISLNAWGVCYALHDTRPYFTVYDYPQTPESS